MGEIFHREATANSSELDRFVLNTFRDLEAKLLKLKESSSSKPISAEFYIGLNEPKDNWDKYMTLQSSWNGFYRRLNQKMPDSFHEHLEEFKKVLCAVNTVASYYADNDLHGLIDFCRSDDFPDCVYWNDTKGQSQGRQGDKREVRELMERFAEKGTVYFRMKLFTQY